MSILADHQIAAHASGNVMIDPFVEQQVRFEQDGVVPGHARKIISYGLSSFGYDMRVANEFMIFTDVGNAIVDPKAFDEKSVVKVTTDVCIIPPNSFALARSMERFRIPSTVMAVCVGKSTYARCGIIINVTPLEPGWHGYVTIEISNTTPLPAKIYANEGIAQVLFFEGEQPTITYGERRGKYQHQEGITLPRL